MNALPKPCPFCGSDDVCVVEVDTFLWYAAVCNNCEASGPEVCISGTPPEEWEANAKADALAAWNGRRGIAARLGTMKAAAAMHRVWGLTQKSAAPIGVRWND